MKIILKKTYENTICKIVRFLRRKLFLNNITFSIISNNCWGGRVYQRYNLPYLSPTIGLMFFADEYIKFVSNLEYYLSLELKFINKCDSKYYNVYKEKNKYYPIGLLGDIEIVFLHYKSEGEAYDKWNRRKERINWNNLVIKFNDQNLATEEHIEKFDKLPFKNKICFVAKPMPNIKSAIFMKKYYGEKYVLSDVSGYEKYLDITKYLNEHTK